MHCISILKTSKITNSIILTFNPQDHLYLEIIYFSFINVVLGTSKCFVSRQRWLSLSGSAYLVWKKILAVIDEAATTSYSIL